MAWWTRYSPNVKLKKGVSKNTKDDNMRFEKVDYDQLKLKKEDKVSTSLIGRKLNQNNKSKVEITEKQAKKSTKVLSRLNKDLNKENNINF